MKQIRTGENYSEIYRIRNYTQLFFKFIVANFTMIICKVPDITSDISVTYKIHPISFFFFLILKWKELNG
jgi:hypothetical protein